MDSRMTRTGRSGLLPLLLLLAACGGERPGGAPTFSRTDAEPIAVPILRAERDRSADGAVARVDVHVLLPATVDEATARATLQHVIDSVAAGDSTVAGIRAAGFMLGRYDPRTGEANVEPAIVGIWAPVDTAGFERRTPRTRFRTTFTVVKTMPQAGGSTP